MISDRFVLTTDFTPSLLVIFQHGGKICDVVTLGNDDLRVKCKELVNDKVDDIIQMVRDSKTPQEICQTVKFCPSD